MSRGAGIPGQALASLGSSELSGANVERLLRSGMGWAGYAGLTGAVASVLFPFPVLTTIEGIIDRAVAGLEQDQPLRRVRCCGAGRVCRDTPLGNVLLVSVIFRAVRLGLLSAPCSPCPALALLPNSSSFAGHGQRGGG